MENIYLYEIHLIETVKYTFSTALPPTSNAGDHGSMNSQHFDNRLQKNMSNTEVHKQAGLSEPLASPSPSTKKGSFFKKNVEDGMDRFVILRLFDC